MKKFLFAVLVCLVACSVQADSVVYLGVQANISAEQYKVSVGIERAISARGWNLSHPDAVLLLGNLGVDRIVTAQYNVSSATVLNSIPSLPEFVVAIEASPISVVAIQRTTDCGSTWNDLRTLASVACKLLLGAGATDEEAIVDMNHGIRSWECAPVMHEGTLKTLWGLEVCE